MGAWKRMDAGSKQYDARKKQRGNADNMLAFHGFCDAVSGIFATSGETVRRLACRRRSECPPSCPLAPNRHTLPSPNETTPAARDSSCFFWNAVAVHTWGGENLGGKKSRFCGRYFLVSAPHAVSLRSFVGYSALCSHFFAVSIRYGSRVSPDPVPPTAAS